MTEKTAKALKRMADEIQDIEFDNYGATVLAMASSNRFYEGALWHIKNIWHDASEFPDDGAQILVRYDRTVYAGRFVCLQMSQNRYIYTLNTKLGLINVYTRKWVYVEDLLPYDDDV